MAQASTFLGGAKGRLLAVQIPFRFFGTAVLCHALAWLVLLAAADEVSVFAHGLGWPLAALHLVTLGVLVMTAVGASLQLLPVATRQSLVASGWPYDAIWAALSLGVGTLTLGMGLARPALLLWGALLVGVALLGYLWLLARNLLGAKGMALVVGHAWGAALWLLLVLATAAALVGAYHGQADLLAWLAPTRGAMLSLHLSLAAYGLMGLLVMGFSYILVPMFALSDNPSPRWSRASLGLVLLGLAAAGLALRGGTTPALGGVWLLAVVAGLVALSIHVGLMLHALRTGMRQGLGKPFVLVRLGWAALLASLAWALAREAGLQPPWGGAVLGLLLVGGLLTFLLGVLSRIVPFLASMHAGAGQRRAPTPSSLTAQRALDLHFYCHCVAMPLLLLALVLAQPWLVRLGAVVGLVGAGAFAWFFATAWQRMRNMMAAKAQPALAGAGSSNADAAQAVRARNTQELRQIN